MVYINGVMITFLVIGFFILKLTAAEHVIHIKLPTLGEEGNIFFIYQNSDSLPYVLLPVRRQSTHVEVGQGEIKDEELSYPVNSLSNKLKFLLKLKENIKKST